MRPCRCSRPRRWIRRSRGKCAAIGIVKGKPFNPDARMKKILTEALAVANAASRAMSIGGRPSEGFGYYGADSKWVNGLFVGGYEFMTPPPEITKDGLKPIRATAHASSMPGIWFFYSVTGITPAMCMRLANVGSQYLENFRDSQGNAVRWQQDLQGHACRPIFPPPGSGRSPCMTIRRARCSTRRNAIHARAARAIRHPPPRRTPTDRRRSTLPRHSRRRQTRQLDPDRSEERLVDDPAPLQPAPAVLRQELATGRDRVGEVKREMIP